MTFDEWYLKEVGITFGDAQRRGVYSTGLMKKEWQAAQREAAKRCAEICKLRFIGDRRLEDVGVICGETIEREFGLDR